MSAAAETGFSRSPDRTRSTYHAKSCSMPHDLSPRPLNFDIKAFANTYPSEQPSGRSWKLFYFAAPDTAGRYKDFSEACELLRPLLKTRPDAISPKEEFLRNPTHIVIARPRFP